MAWRVGSKNPLNVYEGDRSVCQCHNPEDARRIVEAFRLCEKSASVVNTYLDGEGSEALLTDLGVYRHSVQDLEQLVHEIEALPPFTTRSP